MFEPGQRRLFHDALRPPAGYRFDCAVGTTFTLDLLALLSVPLSFTFRDPEDGEGQLASDPLALLESARRHASRIVLFCHGGQTSVPRPGQPALAFLEQSVVTALPPSRNGAQGVFHPKIWALRYQAEGMPTRYRLVCQSRNLTFDRSWDASLALDGELAERQRGFSLNGPLAEFVRALPGLACQPISNDQQAIVGQVADELRRVDWTSPDGLKLSRFLPFGVRRHNPVFPDLQHRAILMMSPFLGDDLLQSVAEPRPHAALVSRREELLKTTAETIGKFDRVYAFRGSLDLEPEDADADLASLAGLHAKVYVIDDGWDACVIVGSANATKAALGNPPQNVEFMVELVGRKSVFGIEKLLDPDGDGDEGAFLSLIEPFDKSQAGTVEEDAGERALESLLNAAATVLVKANLSGSVEPSEDGRYTLKLEFDETHGRPDGVSNVWCWPATLAAERKLELSDQVVFEGLSLAQLSGFLAIEVEASVHGKSDIKRFLRPIELSGLPYDRLQRLLASMLGDHSRLVQLLWLLLSPDDDLTFAEFGQLLGSSETGSSSQLALPGLLERMLTTLSRDANQLDAVDTLISELRKTEDGKKLLGTDFDTVWEPLWQAREKMR